SASLTIAPGIRSPVLINSRIRSRAALASVSGELVTIVPGIGIFGMRLSRVSRILTGGRISGPRHGVGYEVSGAGDLTRRGWTIGRAGHNRAPTVSAGNTNSV